MRKTIVLGVAIAFALGMSPSDAQAIKLFGRRGGSSKPKMTPQQQQHRGSLRQRQAGLQMRAAGVSIGLRFLQAGANIVGKAGKDPAALQAAQDYRAQADAMPVGANVKAAVGNAFSGVSHKVVGGTRAIPGKIAGFFKSIPKKVTRQVHIGVHRFTQKHPKAAANIEYGAKMTGAAASMTGDALRNLGANLEARAGQQYGFSTNAQQQLKVQGGSSSVAGTSGVRPELQQLRAAMQGRASQRIQVGTGTSWRQMGEMLGLTGSTKSLKNQIKGMAAQGLVQFNNGRNPGGGASYTPQH